MAQTHPLILLPVEPSERIGKGQLRRWGDNHSFARDHITHGPNLLRQFEDAILQNEIKDEQRDFTELPVKSGIYLSITGYPDQALATDRLNSVNNGYSLLSAKENSESKEITATIYCTEKGKDCFTAKIHEYISERTDKNNPRNSVLLGPVETIKTATIYDIWTDDTSDIPDQTPVWCEVWLRKDPKTSYIDSFFEIADKMGVEYIKDAVLPFPERDVVLAKLDKNKFENLLPVFDGMAECRLYQEPALFFSEMPMSEQVEWCREFVENAKFPSDSSISICILDTGINCGHPLLSPILKPSDCHSFDSSWGTHDHEGHGTQMAGIAAYGNLADALGRTSFELKHCLESGKILAPRNDLDPILYALATAETLRRASDAAPERTRIVCMAVSADSYFANRGEPTSWSSELDAIAAGIDGDKKQLIIVSMGNVDESQHTYYPNSNLSQMANDPAQSWNALTVGSYTGFDKPSPSIANYQVIAPKGGLSPYSATSMQWDGNKWPAKPDVVFEGGNTAQDPQGFITVDEGMSLLTTSRSIQSHLLSSFWATSASTAMCANFAARLQAAYPDLWPETIRGLIVHSADWSDTMISQFVSRQTKGDMANLRRACGYGVPSMDRAIHCMDNNPIMVAQREIRPFSRENGKDRMNLHFYDLPWPNEALQDLGATEVVLRITLSYFIEPSPGQRGWASKFRYASHGLRFDLCGSQESEGSFIRRISNLEDGQDRSESDTSGLSERWLIGKQNRSTGSLHSDIIKTTGAELATCNRLAIYPVSGWWRERKNLGRYASKTRYSLIVSLYTDSQEVDLYTPVISEIANRISPVIRIS